MNRNDMSAGAWRRRAITLSVIAVLVPLVALPASPVAAHPLGNFSVNHYSRIEVAPAQVQVFYVLDLAEIPTFQLKQKIDTNGDGQVDAGEQQAYVDARVAELHSRMALSANGVPVALATRAPNVEFVPGQGGLETVRLSFWMDGALPAAGEPPLKIEFRDENDGDRLGWREIVVQGKGGVEIANSTASDKDVSGELRNYPEDLLNQPRRQTSATFTVGTGAAAVAGEAPTASESTTFGESDSSSQLAALINYRDLTPQVAFLTFLAALGLGGLHALEPGHGKSVAAAYLVGTRATPMHAFLLGTTVTVTHTASVFAMGLVTLFLSAFIVPERLFPYLGLLSAVIVIVMGISMVVNALRDRRTPDITADHTHRFDANTNQLMHAHGGKQHAHVPQVKMNARNVLAVGISGGLVPCPGALIVMLSAIALGRVGVGMLLIVAFSLGLAGVLTAISLLIVYGKRTLRKSSFAARFASARTSRLAAPAPVLSGVLVVGSGLLLLSYALPFLQLS